MVASKWLEQAIDNASPPSQETNGQWYVAVTTAPRKNCTLETCINSLRVTGWEPTIFAEPGSTTINANYIWNEERRGCWHNWLHAVRTALESNAELILTAQDDCLFHPETREFTEEHLWPSDYAGFLSLYTPRHYTIDRRGDWRNVGINQISTSSLWGACALVWKRETLQDLLKLQLVERWLGARPASRNKGVYEKRQKNPWMIANSDTAIGMAMQKLQKTMWFVDPSPVQHIAEHSTLGHGGNTGRRNCVRFADHSISLKQQVFPQCSPVK